MKRLTVAIGTIILILGIIMAASTFIVVPENKTQAYQVPKSTIIVDCFGLIGPTYGVVGLTADWVDGLTFNAGDLLNIQVNVTSGKNINFYVDDGSTIYLSYPNTTSVNTDWTVPRNSSYNFVFSSSNTVSAKDVHWKITKQWNETDYRGVSQNVPLFPFQVFYAGAITALSGLAIMIYGYGAPSFRINRIPSRSS
jgi:hypothetical protein